MSAQPSPGRTEAFSDGVIAVIITVMVLELKVPHADGLRGFVAVLPGLAVYALSFVFTGIYWVNHHHMIDRLEDVDTLILWTNLLLLFSLSLLPFFTNYMVEKGLGSFSVSLYAASLSFCAVTFQMLSLAVDRHNRLRYSGRLAVQGAAEGAQDGCKQGERLQHHLEFWKGLVSLMIYVAGIGLARVSPTLTLGLLALVTVIWIVPTFGTRRARVLAARHEAGHQAGHEAGREAGTAAAPDPSGTRPRA